MDEKSLAELELSDPEMWRRLQDLIDLNNSLRERVASRWQRSLPFADMVVDRWKRAQALGFGEGTSIYDSALVFGDVKVGKNSWIGPGVILDGSGGDLQIGSFCSISAGVQIYTHHTVRWSLSGGQMPYDHAPTRIGSRCYIGPQSIISMGVTIGDGCVIGAQSFVDKDIPPASKAFGTPCRVVGTVLGNAGRASDLPSHDQKSDT